MIKTIDGALFARMIVHGSACINAQKQEINELNVVPVPDGDTGTNMSMTIGAAAEEMGKKSYDMVGAAANATANALLRGARGHSGVILSLLFLDFGVAAAYKAVMKPAEGTILTVSRLTAAAAAAAARENDTVEVVLEKALEAGREALEHTTEQNPVLKKAGVVDSGGKGFLVIFQGMLDEMKGEPMPEGADLPQQKEGADFAGLSLEDITFTYDTVFIVRRTPEAMPLDKFRAYLGTVGDSLVIGESDEEFKVHVHTDTPARCWPNPLNTVPWSWPRSKICVPRPRTWPRASMSSPPTTWRQWRKSWRPRRI